jgi:hypothetical protein
MVDKNMKRKASWRGKLLSHAARLTLIKACSASIPVYVLSFIKFPKWAIKLLNIHLDNCLWNDSQGNHKYHLANWDSVSMLKDFGGLGVPNLRDLNICLLGSWIKRYQAGEGSSGKKLLTLNIELTTQIFFCTNDSNSFQSFKGFMWAAKAAKLGFRWKVGNGRKVKF